MVDSVDEKNVSFSADECIRSCLICASTAVIPSLVLLGVLRLTLCLMRLALPPAAAFRIWDMIVVLCFCRANGGSTLVTLGNPCIMELPR
jgi:hypothetical protein